MPVRLVMGRQIVKNSKQTERMPIAGAAIRGGLDATTLCKILLQRRFGEWGDSFGRLRMCLGNRNAVRVPMEAERTGKRLVCWDFLRSMGKNWRIPAGFVYFLLLA